MKTLLDSLLYCSFCLFTMFRHTLRPLPTYVDGYGQALVEMVILFTRPTRSRLHTPFIQQGTIWWSSALLSFVCFMFCSYSFFPSFPFLNFFTLLFFLTISLYYKSQFLWNIEEKKKAQKFAIILIIISSYEYDKTYLIFF